MPPYQTSPTVCALPADAVIAASLTAQFDDSDDREDILTWLPYATKVLADLYAAGFRVIRS